MTDLSQVPTSELQADLAATRADIVVCRRAVLAGVETYGDGQRVADRFRDNQEIKRVIEAELKRRGEQA